MVSYKAQDLVFRLEQSDARHDLKDRRSNSPGIILKAYGGLLCKCTSAVRHRSSQWTCTQLETV